MFLATFSLEEMIKSTFLIHTNPCVSTSRVNLLRVLDPPKPPFPPIMGQNLNATARLSPKIRVSTPQIAHSALDRYAMARKYAGINVKTQEAAAAITHRHTFRAQSRKTSCAVVLCFFRSVLSTWSLHRFKNDTWLLGT